MNKLVLLAVMVVAPVVGAPVVGAGLAQSPERPKVQDSSAASSLPPDAKREQAAADAKKSGENQPEENGLSVHYLEVVTPLVNETCEALGKAHRVTFSEPVAELGNARTARLKDGGRIGVRAPMRTTEAPVVRPYVLVDDIDAALKAAVAAGGQVAMAPTKVPGLCTFAIYVLGGIDHGLWQHAGTAAPEPRSKVQP